MKVLVYHPTGNQNVRALLRGLARHDMLHSFHTTVAVFKSAWYYKYLKGFLGKIRRRTYDDFIKDNVIEYPIEELLMFGGLKTFKGKKLNPHLIDLIVTKRVVRYIQKHHDEIDAIYCYPGNASLIINAAHEFGIPCFFELTTAYYKNIHKISEIEKAINPEWARTITLYEDLERCKQLDKELEIADFICCASSYIEQSLIENGFSKEKIKVIPYGFPKVEEKTYKHSSKLKVLYVGSITQAKGLSYMLEAIDRMKDSVELTIIGNCNNPILGIIDNYNYLGSLSHDGVLRQMKEADILLFPTLTDGFGMVITESMSVGTPVIATVNSCARDIITNNKDGWVIPIQNSEAIISILENVIINPDIIENIGKEALKTAKNHPWVEYEDRVTLFIFNKTNSNAR